MTPMPQNHPGALLRLRRSPEARAILTGSAAYPSVTGAVDFYQTLSGVLVAAQVTGLPAEGERCAGGFFAFHIHEGSSCSGNAQDPFADAGTHYNPEDCPHPAHAGDLPPLLSCGGRAMGVVLTDRFTVLDVLGRTVVVHLGPDDFTSQPAGNAGAKIACGVIRPVPAR